MYWDCFIKFLIYIDKRIYVYKFMKSCVNKIFLRIYGLGMFVLKKIIVLEVKKFLF